MSFDKNLQEEIISFLFQIIQSATGLPLDGEIVFLQKKKKIEIILFGNLHCEISIEQADFRDILKEWVLDHSREIQHSIVKNKIDFLEYSFLPRARKHIFQFLQKKGFSEEMLENISLEIKDYGYFPKHHGMVEEEYVRGWPEIGLEIRNLENEKMDPLSSLITDLDGYMEENRNSVEDLAERFLLAWKERD